MEEPKQKLLVKLAAGGVPGLGGLNRHALHEDGWIPGNWYEATFTGHCSSTTGLPFYQVTLPCSYRICDRRDFRETQDATTDN